MRYVNAIFDESDVDPSADPAKGGSDAAVDPPWWLGIIHSATAFHHYYAHVRVLTDDEPLSQARLVLMAACRQTLANGLAILGITAPERMQGGSFETI